MSHTQRVIDEQRRAVDRLITRLGKKRKKGKLPIKLVRKMRAEPTKQRALEVYLASGDQTEK